MGLRPYTRRVVSSILGVGPKLRAWVMKNRYTAASFVSPVPLETKLLGCDLFGVERGGLNTSCSTRLVNLVLDFDHHFRGFRNRH